MVIAAAEFERALFPFALERDAGQRTARIVFRRDADDDARIRVALARANAAVAGAWKPALVLRSVSRAVSAREAASERATSSSFSQARRL